QWPAALARRQPRVSVRVVDQFLPAQRYGGNVVAEVEPEPGLGELPGRGQLFFRRVAPPRPRRLAPASVKMRCTKPYERPCDSASARMLAPWSYFFFSSEASLSRAAPVIRAPFLRSAT